jgi:hypothetical protein
MKFVPDKKIMLAIQPTFDHNPKIFTWKFTRKFSLIDEFSFVIWHERSCNALEILVLWLQVVLSL